MQTQWKLMFYTLLVTIVYITAIKAEMFEAEIFESNDLNSKNQLSDLKKEILMSISNLPNRELVEKLNNKLDALPSMNDITGVINSIGTLNNRVHGLELKMELLTQTINNIAVPSDNARGTEDIIDLINDEVRVVKSNLSSVASHIYEVLGMTRTLTSKITNATIMIEEVVESTNPCMYPFFNLNGQCIAVIRTKSSRATQRKECKKLGNNVDLLEVREKTLPLLKRYMKEFAELYSISTSVWIGGLRNNEGRFKWPSGQNVSLTWGWYSGEPNNYRGREDCMMMFIEEGEFNDKSCAYSIGALYEKIV